MLFKYFHRKKMCAFPWSPLHASQPLLREPLPCWDGARGCSPTGMCPPATIPSSPAWVSEPSKALCFPSLDNRGRNLQTPETRHCSSACLCKSREDRPWLSPSPTCLLQNCGHKLWHFAPVTSLCSVFGMSGMQMHFGFALVCCNSPPAPPKREES